MWAVEMIEIRKEFLADVDISVDLGEDMGDFVQSGDTITIRSLYGDRSLELSDFEDYCYED